MKYTATFKFIIIAAMASIPVLASCQKEQADETPDTPAQADEVRVITLQFANSTKTALDSDGVTPKFENGDQILLSNGTDAPETATVSVAGGKATCPTKLKGTLTAVYPATAAKLNGNAIEGVLVPTVQDGTFKSANICMAENIIDASANFVNQTAVFRITPGAGSNTEYVRVISNIAPGYDIANFVPEGSEFTQKNGIHVASASVAEVFVSILVPSGLRVCDLTFYDGKNIKKNSTDTGAIAVNTINTVNKSNWNPYVVIGGLKWALVNVGASKEMDTGKYFKWGDVTGQTWNGSSWSGGGFPPGWENVPAIGDPTPETLPLEYDAARVNWGAPWRMPTSQEFQKLYDACLNGSYDTTTNPSGVFAIVGKGIYWCTNYDGVAGCLFCDGANKLFILAAGGGYLQYAPVVGGNGGYWSSSLNTDNHYQAYDLFFDSSSVNPQHNTDARFGGGSVRPVSD